MERTKKVNDEVEQTKDVRVKLWYKKVGGGSLRFQGKIIKPEQKFQAFPEDIPDAFKDTIILLDGQKDTSPKSLKTEKRKYELQHTGSGWYNIIDVENDKEMNDSKLRKADAEKLLEELQA